MVMASLQDRDGTVLLHIQADRILDSGGQVIAIVEGRGVRTTAGVQLGRVTSHGRFIDGEPLELVVVVKELRDAMGKFIGRFEDATPAERGLLALVYGQLVTDI